MARKPQSVEPRHAPDTPFSMKIEKRPGAAVVRMSGSCSMEVSEKVGQCLIEIAVEPTRLIVLEMSGVDFMESTGLGGIVAGYLRCRRNRGEMRIVAPQQAILSLLELTRLTKLFRVFDTVDEALAEPIS